MLRAIVRSLDGGERRINTKLWYFRKNRKNPETDWRTAGIIGLGSGVGVTHLTVWTANYLRSACGESVAVLEWNMHGDFERLERACMKGKKQERPFSLLGVDYYANATAEDWNFCIGKKYRRILVDFGEETDRALQLCSGLDRKIVLGAFSEWRSDAFVEFLRMREDTDTSWKYAAAFGSEEFRLEAEKKCRIGITRIPFSVDAFQITGQDMQFFRHWL